MKKKFEMPEVEVIMFEEGGLYAYNVPFAASGDHFPNVTVKYDYSENNIYYYTITGGHNSSSIYHHGTNISVNVMFDRAVKLNSSSGADQGKGYSQAIGFNWIGTNETGDAFSATFSVISDDGMPNVTGTDITD